MEPSYAKQSIYLHSAESELDSWRCQHTRLSLRLGSSERAWLRARRCTRALKSGSGPQTCFSTIHGKKAHSPSYLSGARTPAPEQRDPSARDGGGVRSPGGETLRKGARQLREGIRAGRARPGLAAAAPGWGCARRPEARAPLTEVQELLHGERGWREARVEVHLAGNAAFGRRAGARVRGEAAADATAGGAQPGARAGRGGSAKQPR